MTPLRSRLFLGALAFAALFSGARSAQAIDDMRYPRLHRASEQLDNASDALNGDTRPESDYNGHRARALDLIRQAKSELDQAAQAADNPPPPPAPAPQVFNDQPTYDQPNYNDSNYNQGNYNQANYAEEPVYTDPPPTYVPPPAPVVYLHRASAADPVGCWGHHPIPGGGWCLAEGAHLHNYEPEFFDQFHLVEGYFKFGEGFADWGYAGPHPIPGGGWCNIPGYHRHNYRPEVGFIYDPVRRGYYYNRERAVVIRTEFVAPPPSYRPPVVVVEHYNHPQPVRPAPIGTPPPQPWRQERVLAPPHPAGQPPQQQFHPQSQQPGQFHPAANSPPNQMPGFHQTARRRPLSIRRPRPHRIRRPRRLLRPTRAPRPLPIPPRRRPPRRARSPRSRSTRAAASAGQAAGEEGRREVISVLSRVSRAGMARGAVPAFAYDPLDIPRRLDIKPSMEPSRELDISFDSTYRDRRALGHQEGGHREPGRGVIVDDLPAGGEALDGGVAKGA